MAKRTVLKAFIEDTYILLQNPKNQKKFKKVFLLTLMAFFGIVLSIQLVSSGLVLLIESGVPIRTLKIIFGAVLSTGGVFGFLYCIWIHSKILKTVTLE